MLKMVDGTGIIGVDMVCPLGGTVSPPQPPNFDKVEMEGVGSLMLPNSLKAPLERLELIGNSVQGENPAPDNPKEIKSAGRKSKNLFDISDLRVGQVQKDGTINEKSTYSRTAILDVPEDGKYRIAFNSNDDYTMLYFAEMYTNGVYSQPYVRVHAGNSNSLISLKKGKNILSFSTYNNNTQVDFPKDHNIMIAAESETLDYEPYGYLLDVKVTGKNLLDKSIILPLSSYDIKDGIYWRKYFYLLPNTDYLIRVTPHYTEKLVDTSGFLGVGEPYDNNLPNGIISLIPDVGTTDKTNYFRTDATGKVILKFKDSANEENIRKMLEQVEITLALKTFNNEHEPYTEQAVQIALDEPLRGIGDYKDVLTKDGVVRKIKRIVLDGSENWVIHKEKETTVSFWTNSFKFLFPTHNTMLVDKFAYVISGMNKEDVSWSVYGSNFFININKDIASNLESFKIWLSKNTVTVEYIAIETTTEPLPESVQQQLQALHSENGTTHVFVDSGEVPCGIKLTYRKEK